MGIYEGFEKDINEIKKRNDAKNNQELQRKQSYLRTKYSARRYVTEAVDGFLSMALKNGLPSKKIKKYFLTFVISLNTWHMYTITARSMMDNNTTYVVARNGLIYQMTVDGMLYTSHISKREVIDKITEDIIRYQREHAKQGETENVNWEEVVRECFRKQLVLHYNRF